MMRVAILMCAAGLLTACSSNPTGIEAAYISPLKYKDYSCDDIAMEVGGLEQRTLAAYQAVKQEQLGNDVAGGVGVFLFWPALFALGGDGPESYEFAQLKGEFEALREISIDKDCQIEVLLPEEIRADDREQEIREIKAERGRACPRRSTNVYFCRIEWERTNPEKAAILNSAKD